VQRFPTPLLNPSSRLGAQLADLSFLNHCASTSIEIPSSCAWISGNFSVGIGSQRTPSSKIAASVVLGLALGLSIDLVPDILLLQRSVALYWR
jgi:hypothetical protein